MSEGDVLEVGAGISPDPRATVTSDVRSDLDHIDYGGVDIGTDRWPFEAEQFSKIIAHHVLEHIPPDRIGHVFTEVDRVLKPSGEFEAIVPHAGTWDSNTDPTHFGVGGWTADVDKYLSGELEEYWPELEWDVSAHADLKFPLFVRESRRITAEIESGSVSNELVKIPFVTGTVMFIAKKD